MEFKFFKNQLIAASQFFKGLITDRINEEYLETLVTGLGPRKNTRTTTTTNLAGIVNVEIYEYVDVLVLFRSHPLGQKEGFTEKENSIVIIYKPTFDQMIYYRKHSEGDVEEIVDYDYIEF